MKSAWATTSISATATACARRCSGVRIATRDSRRANPARLYSPVIMDPVYGYQAVNVEAQQSDPSSLLNWMRNMIALRKLFRVFGRGTLEFLYTGESQDSGVPAASRWRADPVRRESFAIRATGGSGSGGTRGHDAGRDAWVCGVSPGH